MARSSVLHWCRVRYLVGFGLLALVTVLPSTASAATFNYQTEPEAWAGCNARVEQSKDSYPYNGCYDPDPSDRAIKYYNQSWNKTGSGYTYGWSESCPSDQPYDPATGQCAAPPGPTCETDTIPGGDINGGFGSGIYDVQGCAYTCGTNYSKLDGSTSMYDAQECTGTGQPYSSDDPDDYPDAPSECTVNSSDGSCLDMEQQPGGSCPSGTTYGEVNGTSVCVPGGDSTDPLDPGTQGKAGQGGDEPTDLGTGNGESDGTNEGGTSENGSSTGTGTESSTTECTSTTDESGTTTESCTTTGESTEETDYGTVTTPSIGENQFYKPIDKTAESVVSNFKGKVMQTPIVSGVEGFFEVQLGGTCPTWTIPSVWVFDPITIDAQCSSVMQGIWPYIAAIIIASCAFVAFRIAFL